MQVLLKWVFAAMALMISMPPPVFPQYDGIIVTQGNLQALLAFKLALEDPHRALASWNESSGQGACSGSWVGVKCSHGQVIVLQLPGKGLGGMISEQVGQLTQLRKLNLHTNRIGGAIPVSLAVLPNLRGLYLFANQLSGTIPAGIGNSPVLQAVDLSSNNLVGSIPAGLTASSKLFLVDLSFNNLTGSIPAECATNPSLTVLNLSNNQLTGVLPDVWGGNGSASQLQSFIASNNNLSGSLPPSLGNLTALQALDLSDNRLNGTLPGALAQLVNLTSFNVSYNLLTGPIPAFKHSFNASSFLGNAGLCGFSGASPCPISPAPAAPAAPVSSPKQPPPVSEQPGQRTRGITTLTLILIVLGSALAFSCAIGVLLFILWRTRHEHQPKAEAAKGLGSAAAKKAKLDQPQIGETAAGKLVHFDAPEESFTADDLLCATAEVMGKSSYGTVYKASLENGNTVVVKRLREGIVKSQKEFEGEVNVLGKIRHPNLVTMRAYYWGPKDEKLLVFEFLPGGSLAAFLHARGPETLFGWTARMKIAAGAARGLNYLHMQEKIIHGNLSSSNILLDSNLSAKISDFGLARLMTASANSNVIATAGAQGYRAPELTKLKKATTKSDVYSFGIVLLELLTGKPPGEPISIESGTLDLPEWVSSVMKEEWTSEVFDVELMKGSVPPSQDDMLETLQLALKCISSTPSLRPEMVDVMHQLEEVACEIPESSSSVGGPG
ncbi:hypothetical protein O6H91_04G019500 [Diphasiastrum complanatum]|uniref:Uncharacterized protein n=1 Tax=Diphasiastrum complanatum TaxID=34168 RepID=A0ACC2DUQ1_DIPCM|nr:hypothetical protein O6H91_04G019500 [Diphasiastrum complanatum]